MRLLDFKLKKLEFCLTLTVSYLNSGKKSVFHSCTGGIRHRFPPMDNVFCAIRCFRFTGGMCRRFPPAKRCVALPQVFPFYGRFPSPFSAREKFVLRYCRCFSTGGIWWRFSTIKFILCVTAGVFILGTLYDAVFHPQKACF